MRLKGRLLLLLLFLCALWGAMSMLIVCRTEPRAAVSQQRTDTACRMTPPETVRPQSPAGMPLHKKAETMQRTDVFCAGPERDANGTPVTGHYIRSAYTAFHLSDSAG